MTCLSNIMFYFVYENMLGIFEVCPLDAKSMRSSNIRSDYIFTTRKEAENKLKKVAKEKAIQELERRKG